MLGNEYFKRFCYSFVREMPGTESYLIAINFSEDIEDKLDLNDKFGDSLPESGEFIASANANTQRNVPFNPLVVGGGNGVVARFKPAAVKSQFNRRADISGRCFNPRKVCVDAIGILEVC